MVFYKQKSQQSKTIFKLLFLIPEILILMFYTLFPINIAKSFHDTKKQIKRFVKLESLFRHAL